MRQEHLAEAAHDLAQPEELEVVDKDETSSSAQPPAASDQSATAAGPSTRQASPAMGRHSSTSRTSTALLASTKTLRSAAAGSALLPRYAAATSEVRRRS